MNVVATARLDFTKVACSCEPGTEEQSLCNYGRSCGSLRADGRDVGKILISEGLAVPFICGRTTCPPTPGQWCWAFAVRRQNGLPLDRLLLQSAVDGARKTPNRDVALAMLIAGCLSSCALFLPHTLRPPSRPPRRRQQRRPPMSIVASGTTSTATWCAQAVPLLNNTELSASERANLLESIERAGCVVQQANSGYVLDRLFPA